VKKLVKNVKTLKVHHAEILQFVSKFSHLQYSLLINNYPGLILGYKPGLHPRPSKKKKRGLRFIKRGLRFSMVHL